MSQEEPRVVSELNTFLVNTKDIKPVLSEEHRIAELLCNFPDDVPDSNAETSKTRKSLLLDEDGDVLLERKRRSAGRDERIYIEYQNSTTLNSVGLQIWRGAFLLGDYIIENKYSFMGKSVLELGAGTGVTSIVASMYAEEVIATDLNDPAILDLILCNFEHNSKLVKSKLSVLPLDFMNGDWSTKLEDAVASADVILAADVVYYDKTTEAFVNVLKRIFSTGVKSKDAYVAMEKRYVFTVEDLDTVAPMYAHFVDLLDSVLNLKVPSKGGKAETVLLTGSTNPNAKYIRIEEMTLDFPQHFNYEKCKELVLWQISTSATP